MNRFYPSHSTKSSTTRVSPAGRRSGSVLVMVGASMFVLLGFCAFAVDFGISVNEKNRLQRTVDAAALAGGSQLRKTMNADTDLANARTQAIANAARNNVTLVANDIQYLTEGTVVDSMRIRVTKSLPRKFLFGAAIGVPNGQVTASAIAGQNFVTGMRGVVPLGVSKQTYLKYVPTATNSTPGQVTLTLARNTSEKFGPLNSEADALQTNVDGTKNWPGNTIFSMVALDLRNENSGNSGSLFEKDLASGNLNTQINVGMSMDPLGSSVSSQGQKIKKAIDDRIAAGSRLMYVLVGEDGYAANNSNPKLTLKYYAPFYIDEAVDFTKGNDPTALIKGRFMKAELSSTTVGLTVSQSNEDTGLSVLRMME